MQNASQADPTGLVGKRCGELKTSTIPHSHRPVLDLVGRAIPRRLRRLPHPSRRTFEERWVKAPCGEATEAPQSLLEAVFQQGLQWEHFREWIKAIARFSGIDHQTPCSLDILARRVETFGRLRASNGPLDFDGP